MRKLLVQKTTTSILLLMLASIMIIGCATKPHPLITSPVTIFKTPSCGCCVGYMDYIEKHGIQVDVVHVTDLSKIHEEYGVPSSMGSCHTMVVDNYVVEGHVPLEAIEQLMIEQPDIDGIALPRMPSGSPGMPGPKKEPFTLYSLTNGSITVYTKI